MKHYMGKYAHIYVDNNFEQKLCAYFIEWPNFWQNNYDKSALSNKLLD